MYIRHKYSFVSGKYQKERRLLSLHICNRPNETDWPRAWWSNSKFLPSRLLSMKHVHSFPNKAICLKRAHFILPSMVWPRLGDNVVRLTCKWTSKRGGGSSFTVGMCVIMTNVGCNRRHLPTPNDMLLIRFPLCRFRTNIFHRLHMKSFRSWQTAPPQRQQTAISTPSHF